MMNPERVDVKQTSLSQNGVSKSNGAFQSKASQIRVIEGGFSPHWLVRPARAQTVLSILRPRYVEWVLHEECPIMLDGGPDRTGYEDSVRLLSYYTRRKVDGPSRGLVIVLHGWEGNSHSTYGLVAAHVLCSAGYDVVRINMRDHGPGLHVDPYALNRGVFLGTLIEEVHTAAQQAALLAEDGPVFLLGPSMGGNFALRMAMLHSQRPIRNLRQVIAISPAIHPAHSIRRIDSLPQFRRYFRSRWVRSLSRKERTFPELYHFEHVMKKRKIWDMTECLIREYSTFGSAEEYFSSYAVLGDALRGLSVPTCILTAADDPVIPVEDFYELAPQPLLTVNVEPAGGHVGFVDLFPFRHRLPEMILDLLQQEVEDILETEA